MDALAVRRCTYRTRRQPVWDFLIVTGSERLLLSRVNSFGHIDIENIDTCYLVVARNISRKAKTLDGTERYE